MVAGRIRFSLFRKRRFGDEILKMYASFGLVFTYKVFVLKSYPLNSISLSGAATVLTRCSWKTPHQQCIERKRTLYLIEEEEEEDTMHAYK